MASISKTNLKRLSLWLPRNRVKPSSEALQTEPKTIEVVLDGPDAMKSDDEKEASLNETRKDRVKSTVIELTQRSALHAIPNLFSSDGYAFIKCIWFLCFLVAWSVLAFTLIQTVLNYLEFKVVTTFSVEYENPVQFPG